MKKALSFLLALLTACSAVLTLSSCAERDDGAQISVYLTDEVYDFDPALSYTDDNAQLLISLLFEPLFTQNAKGKVEKAAAKKYEIDRKTGNLTVTLRETYWSNGERVLASDFVYAWLRVLQPGFASPAAMLLLDVKNAARYRAGDPEVSMWDVGLDALNDDTIRISFEAGADANHDLFLENLCSTMLSPVRQSNVAQSADHWTKTAAELSCNGPFHLKQLSWNYGYLTLARNDGFHRPSGSTRAADAYVVPSQIRTLWQVDASLSPDAYLDRMYDFFEDRVVFYMGALSAQGREEAKKVKTEDRLSTYCYAFNTESSCADLQNPEIRRVLSEVLDRTDLVERYFVYGEAATGFVPGQVMNVGRKTDFRRRGGKLLSKSAELSVEEAIEKLQALGATFGTFTLTYNANHADEDAMAYAVAELWGELGYKVTLNAVGEVEVVEDETTYRESGMQVAYETGNYDVIGIDFQMMSSHAFAALASFSSRYGGNTTGWADEAYDALIEDALAEQNTRRRTKILHEAEEKLLDGMAVMPILFRQTYYVCNTARLRNVSFGYNGFPIFTDAKLKKYNKLFFDDLEDTFFPEGH